MRCRCNHNSNISSDISFPFEKAKRRFTDNCGNCAYSRSLHVYPAFDIIVYMKKQMQLLAAAIYIFSIYLLSACTGPQVPTGNVEDAGCGPKILPDYTSIVIPPNIAPLNFEIDMPGDEYVVKVTGADGKTLVSSGKVIQWDMASWHELIESSAGKDLDYEVYVKKDGRWCRYAFTNHVAEEPIDSYLSYRLIEPSFEHYGGMTINMLDLTSFDEYVVYNTPEPCDERRGQCINCHVPRNQYRDGASQFHVRKTKGGTVLMVGDPVRKVNLKTDSTLSAGVYPAWHPTHDFIAYSTNETQQQFFSTGARKVEVYDKASDLILYDIRLNEVSDIASDPDLLETFPAWSPDGRKIYYSVGRYPDGVTPETVRENYDKIRYDIVSRDFDPATRMFYDPDTVIHSTAADSSALLPRVSPDGKYLLYCLAPFGTFHIWHKDSDLYMMDLSTGVVRPLANANSEDTESYHSWSSNSRWIVFSSRRDDGAYTRPYIAYISPDGSDTKAFVVPQKSPDYYRGLMKSYNVPEFFTAPVGYGRHDIVSELDHDAIPARFVSAPGFSH